MEWLLRGVHEIGRVIVPGLKEREQLQHNASRFLEIKKALAGFGCRTTFSDSREEAFLQDPDVTTIKLVVPKQNFDSVFFLLKAAGMKLPKEDSMTETIHYGVIGSLRSRGIISEEHTQRMLNEREILISRGRGMDIEIAKAFEIEIPKEGDNYEI